MYIGTHGNSWTLWIGQTATYGSSGWPQFTFQSSRTNPEITWQCVPILSCAFDVHLKAEGSAKSYDGRVGSAIVAILLGKRMESDVTEERFWKCCEMAYDLRITYSFHPFYDNDKIILLLEG